MRRAARRRWTSVQRESSELWNRRRQEPRRTARRRPPLRISPIPKSNRRSFESFNHFRLETEAGELSLGVDKAMENSMQSFAMKTGERIDRVEDRMSSLEVEAIRNRDGQNDILEAFRRLEARAGEGNSGAASSAAQHTSPSAAPASTTRVPSQSGRGYPECSVLRFPHD